jgi:hypothetical protein
VRLDSIRISSDGRLLLALKGKALADHTFALGSTQPTATIPVSSTAKTLVDVVLPRSFGRRVPRWLAEQIRYTLPRQAPSRVIIGSTVVRGADGADRRPAADPDRVASVWVGLD